MPRISVIMGTYNAGAFLDEAVGSILAQSFADFEFIIIDDGSTDDTPARLARLASDDARIRFISRGNRGLTPTLNEAARLANSPMLARMDADDISMPDRFARQIAFMDVHPECVALGGAYDMIDEAGRRFHQMRQPPDDASNQEACLSGRPSLCHPLVMMRRDAFEKVGGYDESFRVAQDNDLWLRMGEIGELRCLPDVILKYRQHTKSISEARQREQIDALRRGCEAACKRRGIDRPFLADAGWRSDGSPSALFEQHLRYGWWAWKLCEFATARHYARMAMKVRPFSLRPLKLLWASRHASTSNPT
jgi:glycosyltransferase involved in cell wall biosynthesis